MAKWRPLKTRPPSLGGRDCILEHARDAIVIFGRCEDDPIGRHDGVLERADGCGNPGRLLLVAIVQRDSVKGAHLERDTVRKKLSRIVEQGRIE